VKPAYRRANTAVPAGSHGETRLVLNAFHPSRDASSLSEEIETKFNRALCLGRHVIRDTLSRSATDLLRFLRGFACHPSEKSTDPKILTPSL
jgi:hypothetical protein